ncbi:carcinoembryonic antigen-related cell adhesion molecule 1 isoform 1-T1 [Odontesthes bonariensis]|uniref:carcinoembryonic antigen-related cell adhesion molecule 1 isoform X1 n=1 Tax=Odontesthes bonariensis TaxID=219752 RepID=UPI003F5899DF
MKSTVVFVLTLTTITFAGLVHSLHISASENVLLVGSNVTLSSNVTVERWSWRFNDVTIVIVLQGSFYIGKSWENRTTLNLTTSSLTIRSLTVEDSGEYTFEKLSGDTFTEVLKLSVQEPISNVTLRAKSTNLVEFNDTAVLVCSVSSGTSLSYEWWMDNSTITNGDVQLSNKEATLSIVNVTHYYQGQYKCKVSNGFGQEFSGVVHLNINYGPSNTTMMVMPAKEVYKSGSNITLSCATQSSPPATVQWMFNDTYLDPYGPNLQLKNVLEGDTGHYKCVFHNNVTFRFSSKSTMIQVTAPVTAVVISRTSGPAILHESFTLKCEVTGRVDSIQWWRNDQQISADNRVDFGINKTLTLNPVQHSDGGRYSCRAFNSVSNMTSSPFEVQVNYGPETPTITGPNVVKSGDSVTLSCNAASTPESSYVWYFDGGKVSTMSKYVTPALTKGLSWKYTCMAFNNITNKNSTAHIMITVVDPIENVRVQAEMKTVMESSSYTLTCNVTGDADHIYWTKNNESLQEDETIIFRNMKLLLISVQRSDTGHYRCMAKNAFGNMTSAPYNLVVNYGPDIPTITGPNVVKRGDNVTLSCNAASTPESSYVWSFDGRDVSTMSKYVTPALTKDLSGKYTCEAFNNITNKQSTAHIMITVVDPIENVRVQAEMKPAVENSSYALMCNVTGDADHIYWMKNNESLHDNETIIFQNMKLVFMSVQRSDTGYYRCMAKNAFGNMTSAPYMLIVNYGPDIPTITGPNVVKRGDNVTLSCNAASTPESSYVWSFDGRDVSTMSKYVTPALTKGLSWKYTCMAFNNITNKNSTAHIMITVVDPIENVRVQAEMKPAVENSSYALMCNVTGDADHIYWMKNNESLHVDNTTGFYKDKKTLMFMSVQLSDTGYYRCMGMNAFGNMTSAPYMLLVNFGPDKPIVDGPTLAETGSHADFMCSAVSEPPSHYTWWFNHETMTANTSVFTIDHLSLNMSGEYTCMAHNHVTGRNSTNSITLRVIEAIESVIVHNETTPINQKNFTLTCHVVGPYNMTYWMKDNMYLNMSTMDRYMSYDTDENMLHFTPVTRDHDGTYKCVAVNEVTQHHSPKYMLQVNYGPLSVTISGPEFGKEGTSMSLKCSADSRPECQFHWFLNNQFMILTDGPDVTFVAIQKYIGNYTCQAINPVTNITMYQHKAVTIAAHASTIHLPTQGGLMMMGLFAFSAHALFH